MNLRQARLNRELKKYDRDLYVFCGNDCMQVFRKAPKIEATLYGESVAGRDQILFALTDDWTPSGRPVAWGLEPIMSRLYSMDAWSKEGIYESMVRRRERDKEEKERIRSNKFRALATDIRKDFAKATNDINAYSLARGAQKGQ